MREVYFINGKVIDLSINNKIKEKYERLKKEDIFNNEEYKILIEEINKYDNEKLLTYGVDSLLNLLKDKKESRKMLLKNEYGLIANILYKYKDNLDNRILEYMELKDKEKIIKGIYNNKSKYAHMMNNEINDIELLTLLYCNNTYFIEKNLFNNIEVLKRRYNYYFIDEEDYYCFKNLYEFYKPIIKNEIFTNHKNKLLNLIEIFVFANDKDYKLYSKYHLVAPLFKYMRENESWKNNYDFITKLINEDTRIYKYISKELKSNLDIIFKVLDDKDISINKNDIVKNIEDKLKNDIELNMKLIDKLKFECLTEKDKKIDCSYYLEIFKSNEVINSNKDIITKLIYKTPKSFKYIDKNLIDEAFISYLLNNYKYDSNNEYKIFYSDIRFNKYCMKVKRYYNFDFPKIYKNKFKHIDIVEVISRYIPVNKKGKNYWAVCPFHNDHNPSLCISPEKQIFTCFTCGAHGDIDKFLKLYEGVPKDEYINKDRLGIFKKYNFYYFLYANLSEHLKHNTDIIKKFLNIDGCILKIVPKELRYNEELVEIAIQNDISSFRYIMNNNDLKEKYIKEYPILNYYLEKKEKSSEYNEINNKYNEFVKTRKEKKKQYDDIWDEEVEFDFSDIFSDDDDLPF